ncbi:MAG: hypothetical protein ACI9Y1_003657, partial [Lentisphaeria bacterium]
FYMEAGYFDTASHLKPLLHTWSLSVEEQFYVVFPLLAWSCSKFSRKTLVILFGCLTIVSLVAAAVHINQDHSAVFYLYPFRAWEMFFGTLLALNFVPQLTSKRLLNAVSLAGLALVLIPVFIYSNSTLFPGLNAIAPCLGTVLLIYGGSSHQGWVQSILSSKVPVFLGKISYSLYLWHWPVYVMFLYNANDDLGLTDTIAMALVTLTLSVFSWRFVETPFRNGSIALASTKTRVFTATAFSSLVLMALGIYMHTSNGMPQRLNETTAKFARAASDLFGDTSECEKYGNSTFPDLDYCMIGDPVNAQSYTLIWGDSHGGAYKRGFTSATEGLSSDALIAWSGGCPPVFGLEKDERAWSKTKNQHCYVRNQSILDMVINDKRINSVVLVGRWAYYLNGGGVGVDDHNKISIWPRGTGPEPISGQGEYFLNAFEETINVLVKNGIEVFVVEQPPEFSKYKARRLAISLMNGSADFDLSINALTVEDYNDVLLRQGKMQDFLAKAERAHVFTVLRTHRYFCNERSCSLMVDGSPAYYDNNHVSSHGAVQINSMFTPLLEFLQTQKLKNASIN